MRLQEQSVTLSNGFTDNHIPVAVLQLSYTVLLGYKLLELLRQRLIPNTENSGVPHDFNYVIL